jgi:hypothetical protein
MPEYFALISGGAKASIEGKRKETGVYRKLGYLIEIYAAERI